MNQKITKLVRQALKECVSTPVESVIAGSIDGHGIVEIPNSFAEKFAELIVLECLAQVDQVDDMLEDEPAQKEAVAWVGLAIAKHFGVKE
jgi:hypothetical protein